MDFQLSDEQQQLKKTVREFAEREIAPNVMKWDEASEFPLATIKELGKLGIMGTIFPAELGGAGMGYIEYATAIEELSRVDGSIGIIVAAHTSLCTNHIFKEPSGDGCVGWCYTCCGGLVSGSTGVTTQSRMITKIT